MASKCGSDRPFPGVEERQGFDAAVNALPARIRLTGCCGRAFFRGPTSAFPPSRCRVLIALTDLQRLSLNGNGNALKTQ